MKRLPKLRRWQPVEITWLDALGPIPDGKVWRFASELLERKDTILQSKHLTIGYVIHITRVSLIVVQSYRPMKDVDGDNTIAAEMEIPIGCIQKIRKLKTCHLLRK